MEDHKELEKEDVRLEGKIDNILESIKGDNGINKRLDRIERKQDFTNGKVRAHQVWISGIVGGAMVLMFVLSFFRDNLVTMVADAVEKKLTDKFEITIQK